jgi:hypothetical protein
VNARRLLQRFRREREPVLSSDHTLDWGPEDIIHPWWPARELPPEIVQLAAYLESFSPERRQVFEEAVSANGCPAWVHKRVEDFGDWDEFQRVCLEALRYRDEHGIPVEASLLCGVEEAD